MASRNKSFWQQVVMAVILIAAILAISSILIIVMNHSPLEVIRTIINGSFGSIGKIADTLVVWVSLAICASGLLVTFRAGQWNIGMEGQIAMGAIFAYGLGHLKPDMPPYLVLMAMILCGLIGGLLWALLVSFLKISGGVNEIFGGLGLNFVATSILIYCISGPWKPEDTSQVIGSPLLPREYWLPVFKGLRLSPYSLILAIVIVVAVTLMLRGTIWGLQLKAIGKNRRSAYVLGIPTKQRLFSAYAVSGLCGGLVGALLVVGVHHQVLSGISSSYGYSGILVVLLSGFNGVWVAPVSLLFAALSIGGAALRLSMNIDPSLGGVLLGVIVISFEMIQGLRQRFDEKQKLKSHIKMEDTESTICGKLS